MKKIYQNPQSEVVKAVVHQRLMDISTSETPIHGGGGSAPRRIPKSI